MKFLIRWRNHEDKRHEALKAFAAMPAGDPVGDGGDKIKLIGRWHDLAAMDGVAICETDDIAAMSTWALQWTTRWMSKSCRWWTMPRPRRLARR